MTNHLFKKIRDAIEGRESRPFLETPARFALTYAGLITLSGRYASAWGLAYHSMIGERGSRFREKAVL
jgi:hypothetical protein